MMIRIIIIIKLDREIKLLKISDRWALVRLVPNYTPGESLI